eukprot:687400-Prymnesium_polylepis.1
MRHATARSSVVKLISLTSESACLGLGHSTIATTPPDGKSRASTTRLVRGGLGEGEALPY